MNSFVLNTKAEFLKGRKTAAYFIALGAGAFVPFVNTLSYIFKSDYFLKRFAEGDAWKSNLNNSWQPAAAFLLPMFVILVTSLVVQIEYRNNTWKQVYASPRSYADVFFSKFLVIQVLILTSLLIFNLCILLSGYIANMAHSGYPFFSSTVPWESMVNITGKMYVSLLGMTAIQYWISLCLKNYIAPLGVGLALLIMGLIIIEWEKSFIFPYAYPALTWFKGVNKEGANIQFYSYAWFVPVLLLAFWDTVKRKERG